MMKFRPILLILLLQFFASPVFSEIIHSPGQDFYLDPPEGWSFIDTPTPEYLAMTDQAHEAVFQVLIRDPVDPDISIAGKTLMTKLKATGEFSIFDYFGRESWLGSLEFVTGPGPVTGWGLIIPWKGKHLTALAFAPMDLYGKYSDALNSALNSLALGEGGRREPGPLSRIYQLSTASTPAVSFGVSIMDVNHDLAYPGQLDAATEVVILRESRLLMPYATSALVTEAWPRFYRQIFRDTYLSLKPLADIWENSVRDGLLKPDEIPQKILTWLQGFEYARKGGISDLSSPWETLKSGEGDCDSRALIYATLLQHFGYPAILMVSQIYGHGMAAVDFPGPGARFTFKEKKWLIAELTAKVSLGQIPQDMADPSKWLGVDPLPKP